MKSKAGEDPGFEIIKEVPGNSGGVPRMMGGLMGGLGGNMGMMGGMGGLLGGQGMSNPNMMKCE